MTQRYINMYKSFEKIKWFGMLVSGVTIFIMMLYTCLDVFLRNIFNSSSLYTYELSQYYFMPMAVFPALAYAYGKGVMPRIEFLIAKVKEPFQRVVAIVLLSFEIVLFLLLTIYGWEYAMSAFENSISFTAGGENYLLGPVILFAPISFLLIMVECIFLLIKNIKNSKPSFTVLKNENDN